MLLPNVRKTTNSVSLCGDGGGGTNPAAPPPTQGQQQLPCSWTGCRVTLPHRRGRAPRGGHASTDRMGLSRVPVVTITAMQGPGAGCSPGWGDARSLICGGRGWGRRLGLCRGQRTGCQGCPAGTERGWGSLLWCMGVGGLGVAWHRMERARGPQPRVDHLGSTGARPVLPSIQPGA